MKCWPLNLTAPEKAYLRKAPKKGEAGSFWEDRGDRHHCGVDLYAPENTEVFSIEEGIVTETGLITSPDILPYCNPTYYVIIENFSGMFCKYGELASCAVKKGDSNGSGDLLLQHGRA